MPAAPTLNRFVTAQQRDYATALTEIKSGRKKSHWIWYIFPQLKGLGNSETAKFYGINDLKEAGDYLAHPVLGPRLLETCAALLSVPEKNIENIMGSPDDLKLRSSMTLFSIAENTSPIFSAVLDKFYNGRKDEKTLQLLNMGTG